MARGGNGFDPEERRAAVSLAAIFGLRMLGLFLILPVFTVYALTLKGATHASAGLALGAYGITQTLLQVPFGMLSDRFGRKPVIAAGMLLFAAGSVIAASSHTIGWMIVGRLLQGAGAVASVVIALVADLTKEEHRTRAMGMIGGTIGMTFAFSVMAGPALAGWLGVDGIFWLIAGLSLFSIAFLYLVVPTPRRVVHHRDAELTPADVGRVLASPELLRLDFGIFSLHLVLTALFFAVPLLLKPFLAQPQQWKVYGPVILVSLALMVPAIVVGEVKHKLREIFIGAVALVLVAIGAIYAGRHSLAGIVAGLLLFFVAFNVLEASLPSLVSKAAPAGLRGTGIGVYNMSEFAGAGLGGAVGGALYGHGAGALFLALAAVTAVWLLLALTMAPIPYVTSVMVPIAPVADAAAARAAEETLAAVRGVREAVVYPGETTAFLKCDHKGYDLEEIKRALAAAGLAAEAA
ncbi:MAG: MFS transporter [Nitrospirae bacterium]|nr:MAG: MFS transporter [Nitrospirota bacterium]